MDQICYAGEGSHTSSKPSLFSQKKGDILTGVGIFLSKSCYLLPLKINDGVVCCSFGQFKPTNKFKGAIPLTSFHFRWHLLQHFTLLWTVLCWGNAKKKEKWVFSRQPVFLSARNMCRDRPTSILLTRTYLNWELNLWNTNRIRQQKGREGNKSD